jgi:predicted CXXCH cytochrome family protein
MKMRLLIAVAVVLMVASPAVYAGIDGSDHDFVGQAWYAGDQLCEVCHVPHNAPESQPLWNHASSAETFTTYGTTLSGQTAGTPGTGSLRCLGCHDGVTNLDAFGGSAGTTPLGAVPGNFGTDLSDDHPIGITASADVTIPAEWERDGGVECSSCHDPHDTTELFFLRASLTNSAICTSCHTTK